MFVLAKDPRLSKVKVIDFGLAQEVTREAWVRQERELEVLGKQIRARDSSVESTTADGIERKSRSRSRSRSRNKKSVPSGLQRPNFREIFRRQVEERDRKGGAKNSEF